LLNEMVTDFLSTPFCKMLERGCFAV
jgi:hypothetical protein